MVWTGTIVYRLSMSVSSIVRNRKYKNILSFYRTKYETKSQKYMSHTIKTHTFVLTISYIELGCLSERRNGRSAGTCGRSAVLCWQQLGCSYCQLNPEAGLGWQLAKAKAKLLFVFLFFCFLLKRGANSLSSLCIK